MFNWFKTAWQDFRIDLAYPAFENKCLHRHLEDAKSQYSTTSLEQQRLQLQSNINDRVILRYGEKIRNFSDRISSIDYEITSYRTKLSYLDRNYKQELDPLYESLNVLKKQKMEQIDEIKRIRSQKNIAYEDLDDAYRSLERAQEDVDSWYAKSERSAWLFGNKGRELPKHSFFGQSFGDLDSAKMDREIAGSEIGSARHEVSVLKAEIRNCQSEIDTKKTQMASTFEKINHIKVDRNRMYELKQQGWSRSRLVKLITNEIAKKQPLEDEHSRLKSLKEDFVLRANRLLGVDLISHKISLVYRQKEEFIALFEDEASVKKRKEEHRDLWMANRP